MEKRISDLAEVEENNVVTAWPTTDTAVQGSCPEREDKTLCDGGGPDRGRCREP